jgi:hypothetical protein
MRARDRLDHGVVSDRPVQTGLVRRADFATTGIGPVVELASGMSEHSQRPMSCEIARRTMPNICGSVAHRSAMLEALRSARSEQLRNLARQDPVESSSLARSAEWLYLSARVQR